MRTSLIKAVMATTVSASLAACQTGPTTAASEFTQPGPAMAATQAQLSAEAVAEGTAQGALGMAAAFDPTGISGVGVMAATGAAHRAKLAADHVRLKAAAEADLQAQYKKYGLNPDGSYSGKPGPGSQK